MKFYVLLGLSDGKKRTEGFFLPNRADEIKMPNPIEQPL